MNINKKVNQIQNKASNKMDDLILKNIKELNKKVYEHFNPILNEMQEIVMNVFSHPYLDIDTFEMYAKELIEVNEPLVKRDDILLEMTEETIKSNKEVYSRVLEELVIDLSKLPITEHRAKMEYLKARNSIISKQTTWLNENYHEINDEIKAIVSYSFDSLKDYALHRVIEDEMEIDEIEIEIEVISNNRLIKMTELNDVVEFLESLGFKKVRQTGSHMMYKLNGCVIPVPNHGKEFNSGLAYQIQKEAYKGVAC